MNSINKSELADSRQVIGLDIGGANIKVSDGRHYSHHEPFALWESPQQLSKKIAGLLSGAPKHGVVAITMTGELTDCFANKKEGVQFIVDATCGATSCKVLVYQVDGRFVDADTAKTNFAFVAASNWHALTSFVSKTIATGQCGLLIDIGSTTTDIIPFRNGEVAAVGRDDFGRLVNGELVYTGATRSSLAGIVSKVVHRNVECPVMNEQFATTLDTNIVLGNTPAGKHGYYTADGQSDSIADCVTRIARLIGKDELSFDLEDAREIADQVYRKQISTVMEAAEKVVRVNAFESMVVVASGQGEFLVGQVCERLTDRFPDIQLIHLSGGRDPMTSTCATAWSIARLANESLANTETPGGQGWGDELIL